MIAATSIVATPILAAAVAAGAACAAAGWAMCSRRCSWLGPVEWRGARSDPPRAALTFDDGPDSHVTPRLLDLLASRGVRAAFFVIGAHAQQAPEIVKRMHEDGHIIGNHTFSHDRLGMFRRRRYWEREIARADDAIASIIGVRPVLFRLPMGMRNLHLARALTRGGYRAVTWTRSARDGSRMSGRRFSALGRAVQAGDILNMHDGCDRPGAPPKAGLVDALNDFLQRAVDRGVALTRLDHLIGGPIYR